MIQASQGATKKKRSFYLAKFNRLKFKLGSANKAKVAIANKIACVIYKILSGEKYKERGYARAKDETQRIKGLVNQLKNMGVKIEYQEKEKIIMSRETVIKNTGAQV